MYKLSTLLALNLIMPSLSVSVSNRLSHRVRAIDPFRAVLGSAQRGIWHSDIHSSAQYTFRGELCLFFLTVRSLEKLMLGTPGI